MSDTSNVLEIWITTQFKMIWVDGVEEIDTPAQKLERVWTYKDAKSSLPHFQKKQPGNSGSLSVPIYGGVLEALRVNHGVRLRAYEHMVLMRFHGSPTVWGHITEIDWDSDPNWAKISLRDQWHKLEFHFLREGDEALATPDPDHPDDETKGRLSANTKGIKQLRNAADNIDGQNYPPLGIWDPDPLGPSGELITVERGQALAQLWDQIGDRSDSPQYTLYARDLDPTTPHYSLLYIRSDIGEDRYDVVFHDGFGLDNAEITWKEYGPPVTHAHAVSQDGNFRKTKANVTAAEIFGVWIDWPSIDFNVRDQAEADVSLGAVAEYLVSNLAYPIKDIKVKVKPQPVHEETGLRLWYNIFPGMRCFVEAKKGEKRLPQTPVEIIQVDIVQQSSGDDEAHFELEVLQVTSSDTIVDEDA